ncbi:hypothetical protein ACFFRR_010862 [Megaselia abdita]
MVFFLFFSLTEEKKKCQNQNRKCFVVEVLEQRNEDTLWGQKLSFSRLFLITHEKLIIFHHFSRTNIGLDSEEISNTIHETIHLIFGSEILKHEIENCTESTVQWEQGDFLNQWENTTSGAEREF